MKRLIAITLLLATLGAYAGTSLMMKHKSGGVSWDSRLAWDSH